jgi:hypothetical protein
MQYQEISYAIQRNMLYKKIIICLVTAICNIVNQYSSLKIYVFSGHSGFIHYKIADHHDITEILLKVALNTIKPTKPNHKFEMKISWKISYAIQRNMLYKKIIICLVTAICNIVNQYSSLKIYTYYHLLQRNSIHGEVCSIQHYVTKFVSDLWQVSGFLRALLFPPSIKLPAMI